MGARLVTDKITSEDDGYLKVAEDSAEFKFCETFLTLVSPEKLNYQKEFKRRFKNSGDGRISWEFWTGQKSYKSAYVKALKEIENIDAMDTPELYFYARQICEERFEKLKEHGGGSYAHQKACEMWLEIRNRLKKKQVLERSLGKKIWILTVAGVVVGSILWNLFWEIRAREEKRNFGRSL